MNALCRVLTAPAPGAIAAVLLTGDGAADLVETLSRKRPHRRALLCDLDGIDEGLVMALHERWCMITPHGGPRVVQRLVDRLIELGATLAGQRDPRELYPEASCDLEADMLDALARAASPAAVDRLLAQPVLWRQAMAGDTAPCPRDALDHLLTPPRVVLVGRANVGKSTLTNRVIGRAASITADLPGTTRDWVSSLAELPTPRGELAVTWHDTPGLRDTADPIERRAIELAAPLLGSADVLIAMRDHDNDWPDTPVRPHLRVWNKCDLAPPPADPDCIAVSAATGAGVAELGAAIAERLGLSAAPPDALWAFCDRLRQLAAGGDRASLARYAGIG